MDKIPITLEQEKDGRWLAEVPAYPGVMAYGATRDEAVAKAVELCLRVMMERLAHGEDTRVVNDLFAVA
jgi:predicted RNase H-like HicB family nuclease